MVSALKTFQTLKELADYVDEKLKEVQNLIIEHQKMLEDVNRRIEVYKRIAGPMVSSGDSSDIGRRQEIEFHGIEISLNPQPEREIEILNEILKRLNERLAGLYKVRRALELLNIDFSARINCQVVIIDDVPKKLIIKF
ncbi:MAG: hypothetical protein QXE58_05615 [Candidatus Methanomethylicia archaeon]